MPPQIANILKNLPSLPGVYRYYGMGDSVLYVGKAKNLKHRVSQYFQNNKLENNPRLQTMVQQIERIEYTTVKTEKEALILEANLIYNLQPKYNVLLKDDRSYLYVRISGNSVVAATPTLPLGQIQNSKCELDIKNGSSRSAQDDLTLYDLPKITLTRRKYDKNSDYFGPYTKKFGIVNVLRVLRCIFPYCEKVGVKAEWTKDNRTCCPYYQLKQCDGICCGKETVEQYLNKMAQIKKVLSGETGSVKNWIKIKIGEAISVNNYELAGLWRDRLNLLDDVIANQQIVLPQPQDLDIITLIHEKDKSGLAIASVFIQNIREGKIINLNNFIMSGSTDELEDDSQENKTESNIMEKAVAGNSLLEKTGTAGLDPATHSPKGWQSQTDGVVKSDATQNGDNSKNGNVGIAATNNITQIQNFVQTFLVNYYSEQAYKPEILLQVYVNQV